MKHFIHFIITFLVFFVVEYNGYDWNPCQGDWCLSVYCPDGTCHVASTEYFVKKREDVQNIINENGIEHLSGIFRVEWDVQEKKAKVSKFKVVSYYQIEEDTDILDKEELQGLTFNTDETLLLDLTLTAPTEQ